MMRRTTLAMMLTPALLVAGCALQLGRPAGEAGLNHDLAIRNVRIVDVVAERVSGPLTILIDDGRIAHIDPVPSAGTALSEIDARGAYALPGLWDMHVHALWANGLWSEAAPAFLRHCITGVRDMGGIASELAAARAYPPPAPRLVAAGPIVDGPAPVDPSVSLAMSGPEEAAGIVHNVSEIGGAFVKTYTLVPPEAFRALIGAAHGQGMVVAGHLPYGVKAADAADLGMRSIEHMQSETGLYCDPESPDSCDEAIHAFKRNTTWQTPTLTVRAVRAHRIDEAPETLMATTETWPADAQDYWTNIIAGWREKSAEEIESRRKDFDRELRLAGLLIERGVPILAGSDAGLPLVPFGLSLHRELEWLTAAGATPAAALRAATAGPAAYFGRDPKRLLAEGGRADLCLLENNPLEDVAHAAEPRLTVVGGRVAYTRR